VKRLAVDPRYGAEPVGCGRVGVFDLEFHEPSPLFGLLTSSKLALDGPVRGAASGENAKMVGKCSIKRPKSPFALESRFALAVAVEIALRAFLMRADETLDEPVTENELSERLRRLDPGATCTVDEAVLARMFGVESLRHQTIAEIEAFALEHRCTISYHEHRVTSPCFEKNVCLKPEPRCAVIAARSTRITSHA
jgi:hypothetical protein